MFGKLSIYTTVMLFMVSLGYSQTLSPSVELLRKEVKENKLLLNKDLETGYKNLIKLLPQARELNDPFSELSIMDGECWYYLHKRDLDSLISHSEKLRKKAQIHKNYRFEGISHIYLAETYAYNSLFDKATRELEKALSILEKGDINDPEIINNKANAYVTYGNVFAEQGMYREAVNQLLLVDRQYKKFKDPERRKYALHNNYSNIALIFSNFNMDSAEFYVNKSIEISQEETNAAIRNYFILGDIAKVKKDYANALKNYQKAEELSLRKGNLLNIEDIYNEIIDLSQKSGNSLVLEEYRQKLKELKLKLAESKNKSLHKILEKVEKQQIQPASKNSNGGIVLFSVMAVLVSGTALGIIYYRKNKTSQIENTEKVEPLSLIEMVKNDDPAFMHAFETAYPGFTEKLTDANPELTKSEIEFCALLKLNLSTKEMARLRALSQRTIQNKKYIIRRKLDIPGETDINEWFTNF